MDKISVKHIISQLKKGDKSGFASLVNAHKNMVYGLSLKMTQSIEDAEEITQDTFVKVFQRINSFKGQSKLSTWIYQIAYFTTINHLRGRKKEFLNLTTEDIVENNSNLLETSNNSDQKKYIELALKDLTPQERAVITLFYLDGHSIKEVGEICGLSLSNTKVKIHRTRAKMKTKLNGLLEQEVHSLY